MKNPTTVELVHFLRSINPNAKFIDKLKIIYRPYICPFDRLLTHIKKGDKIFDIGCGSGQFLSLVAEFKEPASVAGIEISGNLIANAKLLLEKYANEMDVKLATYDGVSIPVDICNYNVITLIDVFHHIPLKCRLDFLAQLFDKMTIGSTLLLKDIDAASILVFANKAHDLLVSGVISREVSLQSISEHLTKIGFTIEKSYSQRTLWYPHYTIIAKKY